MDQYYSPRQLLPKLPIAPNPHAKQGDRGRGGGGGGGGGSSRKPTSDKNRVVTACENCRKRKVKCSGDRPTCKACEENDVECAYIGTRKDRMKASTERVRELEALIQELSVNANHEDQIRIRNVLDRCPAGDNHSVASPSKSLAGSTSKRSSPGDPDDEPHGEDDVGAEVGSNESPDILDEDLNENDESRATGFIGMGSEVQWLRRLKRDTERGEDTARSKGPYGPPGRNDQASADRLAAERSRHNNKEEADTEPISRSTYHMDMEDLELDFEVEPLDIPTWETMVNLLGCYLETVHDTFPIIVKTYFVNQFKIFTTMRSEAEKPPTKWYIILNLMFAIGARYSHLARTDWAGDVRDHLVYYQRAQALEPHDAANISRPDIQQVQITALYAFYYLSIGHVSRSWIMSGLAVHYSYALGLHVRNEEHKDPLLKESRIRLWWAVYSLERLLCMITGRPSVIQDENCSVPLPLPVDEDKLKDEDMKEFYEKHSMTQSGAGSAEKYLSSINIQGPFGPTTALYFRLTVQLSVIRQEALGNLYSTSIVTRSWSTVQGDIQKLNDQLDNWTKSLPDAMNFTLPQPNDGKRFQKERFKLAFMCHGARILINRTCLCRIDPRIENQSKQSIDFNRKMAQNCIWAALDILALVPDTPNYIIYTRGPWWQAVHHIMQAAAVLLLEMGYELCHIEGKKKKVISAIKKAVRYLDAMANDNGAAAKGYKKVMDLLPQVAEKIDIEISEIMDRAGDRRHGEVHYEPSEVEMQDATTDRTQPPEQTNWQDFFSADWPEEQLQGQYPLQAGAGADMTLYNQFSSQIFPPLDPFPDEFHFFVNTNYDGFDPFQPVLGAPGPPGGEFGPDQDMSGQ